MSRRGNCWDNAVAESFFSSLKKNALGREYTKPGIWPGRISSITLKCSTTGPGVTVTLAASVRRPLNRLRREDRIRLWAWGQSKNDSQVSVKPVAIHTRMERGDSDLQKFDMPGNHLASTQNTGYNLTIHFSNSHCLPWLANLSRCRA